MIIAIAFVLLIPIGINNVLPNAYADDFTVVTKCDLKDLVVIVSDQDGNFIERAKIQTLENISGYQQYEKRFYTNEIGQATIPDLDNLGLISIIKSGFNEQKIRVENCSIPAYIPSNSDDVIRLPDFGYQKSTDEYGYVHNDIPQPIYQCLIREIGKLAKTSSEYQDTTSLLYGVSTSEIQWTFTILELTKTYCPNLIPWENSLWNNDDESKFISGVIVIENHCVYDLRGSQICLDFEISKDIPEWIKNNARWWADGAIYDSTFIQGFEFLIKERIIEITPTLQEKSSNSKDIPEWIKNNARWWADGTIDDSSFISGIQFMIKEGIISLSEDKPFEINDILPNKTFDIKGVTNLEQRSFFNEDVPEMYQCGIESSMVRFFATGASDGSSIRYQVGICKFANNQETRSVMEDYYNMYQGSRIENVMMVESHETGLCVSSKSYVVCGIENYAIYSEVSLASEDEYQNIILLEEKTLEKYHKLKFDHTVDISLFDLLDPNKAAKSMTNEVNSSLGFTGLYCKQTEYGFVEMTGRFTNGPDSYSTIYFTLGVLDHQDRIVATGLGSVSNIGPYQTKMFEASSQWSGDFKECIIEIDTAYP